MLAQTIIDAALQELNVYAPNDTISTPDRNWGLLVLNRLMSQLNTKKRYILTEDISSYTITSAKTSYSIGTSGTPDFNTARPVKILGANLIRTSDTPDTRTPIDVIHIAEYKELQNYLDTSAEPTKLLYLPTVPNGTIYLTPISDGSVASLANKLELYTWSRLSAFADLATTSYNLADGYEDMLTYTLAERLAPSYEKTISADLAKLARDARMSVQSLNTRTPNLATQDSGMPGSR